MGLLAAALALGTPSGAEDAKITISVKQDPGANPAVGALAQIGTTYALHALSVCTTKEDSTDLAADWRTALEGAHFLVAFDGDKSRVIRTQAFGMLAVREILVAGDRVLTRDGNQYAAYGGMEALNAPELRDLAQFAIPPPDDDYPWHGGREEEMAALRGTDGNVFRIWHLLFFNTHDGGIKTFADSGGGDNMVQYVFVKQFIKGDLGRFSLIRREQYEDLDFALVGEGGELANIENSPFFSPGDTHFAAASDDYWFNGASLSVWETGDSPKLGFRCAPGKAWVIHAPQWLGPETVKFAAEYPPADLPSSAPHEETSVEVKLVDGTWVCPDCERLKP